MNENGKGTLFFDGFLGTLAAGAAATVVAYVAEFAGNVDVTPLPDGLEPVALGAITWAVGALTAKLAPHRRERA